MRSVQYNLEPVEKSVMLAASIERVWDVVTDNAVLPDWATPVESIQYDARTAEVGSIRRCKVMFEGEIGTIEERCVAIEPQQRMEYTLDTESFGYSNMYKNYGFEILFKQNSVENTPVTQVTMRLLCTPKKVFSKLLNSETTRSKLDNGVVELLSDLKRYIEQEK